MFQYKQRKIKGRKILAHRAVMEEHVGRRLRCDELVHHKNGNTWDNRIENLGIVTAKQHAMHHNQKHPITKACEVCGKIFAPHPTKRKRAKTCSRECWYALLSLKSQKSCLDR